MIKQNHPADLDYSNIDTVDAQQFFTLVRAYCPGCDFIPQYQKFGENKNKVTGYFSVYFPEYNPKDPWFDCPTPYNSICVEYCVKNGTKWFQVNGGFHKNKRYILTMVDTLENLSKFLKDVSLKKTK
jgi:hypothetical protein